MAKYIVSDIFEGSYGVSQTYGNNVEYYKSVSNGALQNGHEGVDWATPIGTPVLAPFDGVIVRDTLGDKDYGTFTVIWDSVQRCALWFCHLHDVTTTVGQEVKRGTVLGHSNNTGNTTGPHLHVNFCETDAQGYRLNRDNGSQGFLNILDHNLVEWKLAAQHAVGNADGSQEVTYTIPAGENKDDWMPVKKEDFIGMRVKCDYYDPLLSAGYASLQAVDDKIASIRAEYEDKIKSLTNENSNLKQDVLNIKNEASHMAELYKKSTDTDVSAISAGIDTERRAGDLENQIKLVADCLNTKPEIKSIVKEIDSLLKNQKATLIEKVTKDVTTMQQNTLNAFLAKLGIKS